MRRHVSKVQADKAMEHVGKGLFLIEGKLRSFFTKLDDGGYLENMETGVL